jgi:hypothetical protein
VLVEKKEKQKQKQKQKQKKQKIELLFGLIFISKKQNFAI